MSQLTRHHVTKSPPARLPVVTQNHLSINKRLVFGICRAIRGETKKDQFGGNGEWSDVEGDSKLRRAVNLCLKPE